MLKGIPPILSPELLKVLCEMGHSDRIVIADGNFPAETMGKNAIVIRCDGHGVPELLDAILQVIPADTYVEKPIILMEKMECDKDLEIPVWETYKEIIANAVIKEDYKDPVPADFSLAAQKSEYKYNKNKEVYQLVSTVTDRNVYVQRHALVMEIINYLCDEEKYTYTLYPTVLGEENTLDGVETFLTKTKEGYCVQYASSLVLLLREAGIPARYVEGYIATGLYTNRDEDAVARYKATVRDSSAHAWVEVWYDGIGWVQIEATAVLEGSPTTVDGVEYVVGTYGTYNTFCISESSYISVENSGKTQFPAGLFTLEIAD